MVRTHRHGVDLSVQLYYLLELIFLIIHELQLVLLSVDFDLDFFSRFNASIQCLTDTRTGTGKKNPGVIPIISFSSEN